MEMPGLTSSSLMSVSSGYRFTVRSMIVMGWGEGREEFKCLLMISGSFQSTGITEYCKEREESLLTEVGKWRHREVKGQTENCHSH